MNIKPFNFSMITSYLDMFPTDQYYSEIYEKKQIVLHHTVSGEGSIGDINWWKSTKDRVATSVIIGRDGKLSQLFSTKHWGHHLGVKSAVFEERNLPSINTQLNKQSIAIELDSWGGLKERDGKFYSYPSDYSKYEILPQNVQGYTSEYRGYKYFEKYTTEQLSTLGSFLVYLSQTYDIPLTYSNKIWYVSDDALTGKEGVYTHTSYRPDKSDTHPQPELIQLLKHLSEMSKDEKDQIWKV